MAAAVYKVTSVHGFRDGWQGIPVYLVLAALCGRIANCKVVLRDDVLVVVNPLRTHVFPKAVIVGVSLTDDGTLQVRLDGDRSVPVFAFGGSLVDRFKGSSREAARRIGIWLRSDRPVSESAVSVLQIRWTRCRSADAALVLCAVVAGAGAIWMALSG